MLDNHPPNHDYLLLFKSAYALADSIAPIHEIKEIYMQKKDMELEEWIASIRELLFQIDLVTFKECNIPIFQTALHNSKILRQDLLNIPSNPIKAEILIEAHNFACILCNIFRKYQHELESGTMIEKKEISPLEAPSDETIDICKQLVNLILGELGFKSSDLVKIY